ncbi:MAG: VWA domain-containing protein [Candidatus Eremiobacteraeota bacterium]|nr:VWA domain-containing protein [Candidatus Eremiobacteraeota bacterium]
MIDFTRPLFLVAALILTAACVLAYRALMRRRTANVLAYTNIEFFAGAIRASRWPHVAVVGAFALAAALLWGALAGPHITAAMPAKDAAVILCIDTSGSMSATDVQPTRWEAARSATRAFIERLPVGTKVGIVTFSSSAGLIQALTSDRAEALAAVDRIPPADGATAIGDALTLAAQQLPARGHRAVVLMTDGVNNRGVDPLEAANALASRHIPVYTVGIGTNDSGLLIPGTAELAQLDEDALRAIAQAGGGAYARVSDARSLQSALSHLGSSTTLERRRIDASLPFAFGGGVLLLATILTSLAVGRFP